MADDEDTDRVFPPFPESRVVDRPIKIGPSIRDEFLAHRRHIDFALGAFAEKLDAALERLAPDTTPSPSSALRKVGSGALAGSKVGVVVVAGFGLAEALVRLLKPEWAGPIEGLGAILRGQ